MHANFYLKKLIIQNFATFKNQTIHFRPGLNAIVGETGSGKSLVLEALQLILGSRADKRIVRKETDYSLIEATFHCEDQGVNLFLASEGFPLEGKEIIIKRLVYMNGTTKTFINQLATTVSFLSGFSRKYIDLVGQFENQKLLSGTYQLQLLDQYAKNSQQLQVYQKTLQGYRQISDELEKLEQSKAIREQRLDYLNYQLQEIGLLNPSSQDEADLLKRKNLLLNVEKNQKLIHFVENIFEGGEGQPGLLSKINYLHSHLVKNGDFFDEEVSELTELEDRLQFIFSSIDKKIHTEFDPQEMDGVIERLDLYTKLKKKFGGTVESILHLQAEFLKEKEQLDGLDLNLEEWRTQKKKISDQLTQFAILLHKKREDSALKLSRELTQKIQSLKMIGATIKLQLDLIEEFNEFGRTKVGFVAETNPGEGFFKVKDVASGGELSRILLGVRQILSSYDSISIFLFDEIDTGIGGETATCIGKALHEVASTGQVIAITHLPQIAQFADSLIMVNKDVQKRDKIHRTESTVKEVVGKLVAKEIKIMSQLGQ
jgi:DNA repair protein RecN (Recombination protein N)